MCTTYPTYINTGAGLNTNERESTNHRLLTYLEDEKNSLTNGCDDTDHICDNTDEQGGKNREHVENEDLNIDGKDTAQAPLQ